MRAKLVFREGISNYVAMMTTANARADFVNIWDQKYYFSSEKMRRNLLSGDRIINYKFSCKVGNFSSEYEDFISNLKTYWNNGNQLLWNYTVNSQTLFKIFS
jgi:hypothetical protein